MSRVIHELKDLLSLATASKALWRFYFSRWRVARAVALLACSKISAFLGTLVVLHHHTSIQIINFTIIGQIVKNCI